MASPNANETAETITAYIKARETGRVFSAFGIALFAFLLLIELFNITVDKRKEFFRDRNKLGRQSAYLLGLVSSVSLLFVTMAHIYYTLDWNQTVADCGTFVQVAIMLLFAMQKQAVYLFLSFRVKIVHEALNVPFARTRKFLLFVALVGVPVAFYPLVFLFVFGTTVAFPGLPGICLLRATSFSPAIVFAVLDSFLAMAFLALFLIPLMQFNRQLKQQGGNYKNNNSMRLYPIARRNVVCSLVVTTVTVCVLSFIAVYAGQADLTHVQVSTVNSAVMDSIVSGFVCHLLSSIWLPSNRSCAARVVKDRCYPKHEENSSGSSSSKDSRLSKKITNRSSKMASGNSNVRPQSKDSKDEESIVPIGELTCDLDKHPEE